MRTIEINPQNDVFRQAIWVSFSLHFLFFLFLTVRAYFSPEIEYQSAIRVDLVGLPDKIQNLSDTTSNSIANESPDEAKVTPAEKPDLPTQNKIENDAININKNKSKQKEAMNRLKQMSAFEKIQSELAKENKEKGSKKGSSIKGNQISKGSQLTGLSKIQADEYIGRVEHQIKQHWSLPNWLSKKDLSAQIRIRFDEKGELIAVQIVKASGNNTFDDIAVETIKKSAPLPAPPEKFAKVFQFEGILLGFPE